MLSNKADWSLEPQWTRYNGQRYQSARDTVLLEHLRNNYAHV